MTKPILAWHFTNRERRLGYKDGRIVRAGKTLKVDPPVALCKRGLHASINPLDALGYSSDDKIIACRVLLSGEVVHGDDKLVGTERKCLWWVDSERVLHEFACWCAKRALKVAGVEDARCHTAIATKLRWLRGEATNAELDVASSAAQSAAWSTAESRWAAWAACSAAESAAGSAARSAARSARLAAQSASSAWSAQNRKLEAMLTAEARRLGKL